MVMRRKIWGLGAALVALVLLGVAVVLAPHPADKPEPSVPAPHSLPSPFSVPQKPRLAQLHDYPLPALPESRRLRYNAYGLPCETVLDAQVIEAGMVQLDLQANCLPDQELEVTHAALRFSGRTDEHGHFSARIPALSVQARFDVTLARGDVMTARAHVPEAARYHRVVLQWTGADAMQLHAREFGADDGARGHIWQGNPGLLGQTRSGHLARLGLADSGVGQLAQVYSFPRAAERMRGVIRISVEAPVTRANCGRMIAASTLQPRLGGGLQEALLSFHMPGCDALGDILVLKNVLRDLKVAQNELSR